MIEKNIDILQNLEMSVHQVWKRHPDMPDSAVAAGYEAAFQRYRAEVRRHTPKPPAITGVELEIYNEVAAICEWRLGRPSDGTGTVDGIPEIKPATADEILDCLRRLLKSVERHGRTGGRQGYLQFIGQFL